MRESFNVGDLLSHLGNKEEIAEAISTIEKTFAKWASTFPKISEQFDLAEKTLFEGLVDYSWFGDDEMYTDVFLNVANYVASADEKAIDREMIRHFRERLNTIQAQLSCKHPKHATVLDAAFAAHREGEYALSIPVFLAQADGISIDLLGEAFFQKTKSIDQAKKLLEETADGSYMESALRALILPGALRKKSSQAKEGEFNRHAVLHGIDTNYGCERNSLKAVSLLCFLSSMLEDATQSREPSGTSEKSGEPANPPHS